jgi:hypothetical protein
MIEGHYFHASKLHVRIQAATKSNKCRLTIRCGSWGFEISRFANRPGSNVEMRRCEEWRFQLSKGLCHNDRPWLVVCGKNWSTCDTSGMCDNTMSIPIWRVIDKLETASVWTQFRMDMKGEVVALLPLRKHCDKPTIKIISFILERSVGPAGQKAIGRGIFAIHPFRLTTYHQFWMPQLSAQQKCT